MILYHWSILVLHDSWVVYCKMIKVFIFEYLQQPVYLGTKYLIRAVRNKHHFRLQLKHIRSSLGIRQKLLRIFAQLDDEDRILD